MVEDQVQEVEVAEAAVASFQEEAAAVAAECFHVVAHQELLRLQDLLQHASNLLQCSLSHREWDSVAVVS